MSRPPREHQFRHPDDISLLSSLQQYYAYLTGRATPGDIRYLYTDLADPATPFRLSRLLHDRHLDVFCLNDTDSDPAAAAEQDGAAGRVPARVPAVRVAVRAGPAAGGDDGDAADAYARGGPPGPVARQTPGIALPAQPGRRDSSTPDRSPAPAGPTTAGATRRLTARDRSQRPAGL